MAAFVNSQRPLDLASMTEPERSDQQDGGQNWGIVGGGMLGLTLAHRLAQQGKRVTIFESAQQLVGLASAWQLGDITWDRHYHVTLLSDTQIRALLAELGLESEIEWVETRTGVAAGGRIHSVSNTLELLRFPVLRWWDILRLGLTVLYASRVRNWQRLEQVLVSDWLTRWSGHRNFERFWLPLLQSKLGEAYHETSAAFIWTTIQRLYAARRSGMKKELFGYVPGGYARVLDRLQECLVRDGVDIELGCRVESVEWRGRSVEVALESGSVTSFDHVVVTAAAPLAARICKNLNEEERSRLGGVRYLGIVCASLLLRRPLKGYYVTNLLDPGLPFTGVIEMSALVDPKRFGGRTLVYLPKYLAPDDLFFEKRDDEIRELFVDGLGKVYPDFRKEDLLDFRVSRVRSVAPIATLGYSRRVPPVITSARGVYLVSSANIVNGTLNVNETVKLAEHAAREFSEFS